MAHDVYRDGRVHVVAELCATCVFRPGNLMALRPGRLRGMVDAALASESAIVCHSTLAGRAPNAVCRGFYDRHGADVMPLRLARALDLIEFDAP